MGLILHALVRFVVWIDCWSMKSLHQAIPDLDYLLSNPSAALSGQEFTIRPWRRYARIIMAGLLLAFACHAIVVISLVHLDWRRPTTSFARILYGTVFLGVVPLGCMLLVAYLNRGGMCVLKLSGVEFHYRGKVVACPWRLFSATGQPVFHPIMGRNRVELPADAGAASLVELRKHGRWIARGEEVNARHFYFRTANEVILKGVYQVRIDELAWLLQHVGMMMCGNYQSQPSTASFGLIRDERQDLPATLHADGTLTVSLTRLLYPRTCCDCGAETTDLQTFMANSAGLHIGAWISIEGAEHIQVSAPVCATCQAVNQRAYRQVYLKAYFASVGLSVLVALFLGAAIAAVTVRGAEAMMAISVGFGIVIGVASLVFSFPIAKSRAARASSPVWFGRYRPSRGTIDIRFRRSAYVDVLLSRINRAETADDGDAFIRPEIQRLSAKGDFDSNVGIQKIRHDQRPPTDHFRAGEPPAPTS